MTLYDIVDVNTYIWIVKTSMGTTRDNPTNQFDISIKLSEIDPFVLTCVKIHILFSTIYFVNNNIYNFVYYILCPLCGKFLVRESSIGPQLLKNSLIGPQVLKYSSKCPQNSAKGLQLVLRSCGAIKGTRESNVVI